MGAGRCGEQAADEQTQSAADAKRHTPDLPGGCAILTAQAPPSGPLSMLERSRLQRHLGRGNSAIGYCLGLALTGCSVENLGRARSAAPGRIRDALGAAVAIYWTRSASDGGRRPARSAGNSPPINDVISAHASPSTQRDGATCSLNAPQTHMSRPSNNSQASMAPRSAPVAPSSAASVRTD